MMAGIRGANTKPELAIRRGLHALGFRYRLHDRRLPSKPDIVLPRYRAVVLVHGCFWHGHDCALFKWPKSRDVFWREKIDRNKLRDARAEQALRDEGWRVLRVWECALKGRGSIGVGGVVAAVADWVRSDLPEDDIRGINADDGTCRLA
ncbi:MAG: very short patch repair endonuclease [Sphingomicrobium sp.]